MRSGYWDWTHRSQDGPHYLRYCGTPPVSHMYGLREALAMIREETLDCVWDRHATLARSVHAAVDAWAAPDGLELHIVDPAARSNAVTTIRTGGIDGVRLRELCEERAGLTLGIGLAPYEHLSFRIGHMGHVNPPMLLGTLGTIEAALSADRRTDGGIRRGRRGHGRRHCDAMSERMGTPTCWRGSTPETWS